MKPSKIKRLIIVATALAITLAIGVVGAYADLVDNGDGTITDTGAGLVWLKNANMFGLQYFNAATQKAQGFGGQWRLPTKNELVARASNTSKFTNAQIGSNAYYWTSEVFATNYTIPGTLIPSTGWAAPAVRMTDGATHNFQAGTPSSGVASSFSGCYVWPVRNK